MDVLTWLRDEHIRLVGEAQVLLVEVNRLRVILGEPPVRVAEVQAEIEAALEQDSLERRAAAEVAAAAEASLRDEALARAALLDLQDPGRELWENVAKKAEERRLATAAALLEVAERLVLASAARAEPEPEPTLVAYWLPSVSAPPLEPVPELSVASADEPPPDEPFEATGTVTEADVPAVRRAWWKFWAKSSSEVG